MCEIKQYTYKEDQPTFILTNVILAIYPYANEISNAVYKRIILNFIDTEVLKNFVAYEVFLNQEHTHVIMIFPKNEMVRYKVGVINVDNNLNINDAISIAVYKLGISLFDAQNYYEYTICQILNEGRNQYTLIVSPK